MLSWSPAVRSASVVNVRCCGIGRWLAFSKARGGFKDEITRGGGGQTATDVFVMRADGSDVRRLTDDKRKRVR
jgi:Tol biopolymer transport system component